MQKTPPQWRSFKGVVGMSDTLIIAGAGGHAKVVADIAIHNGYNHIVFLDDNIELLNKSLGFGIVQGSTQDIDQFAGDVFVAIGNPSSRGKLMDYYEYEKKRNIVTLIHPSAVFSQDVIIESGVVVMPGVVINTSSKICRGSIINTCCSVDHDCCVDSFSHVAVGAHLCGNVKIGNNCWIGAGTTIINNVKITDDVIVGAGAVVLDDITEPGTYVGVPVRKI